MEFSQNIANLAEAMAHFQAEVKDPAKNAKANAGKFSFKYADLDAILKVVRPLLAQNGLSVVQMPVTENGMVGCMTILLHSSGEWLKGDAFLLPPAKNDPQGYGGCITYAKRYSLAAILGISADEDDDANYASGNTAEIQHALPKGIGKGANNTAWVDDIRKKLAATCKEKELDMNFVAKIMQVKFGKDKAGLTVGDYTEMLNNFDQIVAECQEQAMSLFEGKAS